MPRGRARSAPTRAVMAATCRRLLQQRAPASLLELSVLAAAELHVPSETVRTALKRGLLEDDQRDGRMLLSHQACAAAPRVSASCACATASRRPKVHSPGRMCLVKQQEEMLVAYIEVMSFQHAALRMADVGNFVRRALGKDASWNPYNFLQAFYKRNNLYLKQRQVKALSHARANPAVSCAHAVARARARARAVRACARQFPGARAPHAMSSAL